MKKNGYKIIRNRISQKSNIYLFKTLLNLLKFYSPDDFKDYKFYSKNKVKDYKASEGKHVTIPYKGALENTLLDLLGGIRST